MRIPHIINKNTRIAYETSDVTRALLYEVNRVLLAEKLSRPEDNIHSLVALCILVISRNFESYPIINEFVLCADRDYLLQELSTDLPLSLVVPLIEDEIYWNRRYTDKYGVLSQHKHEGWTWKCIYLENHIQELIETAQPEYNDEENLEDITTLLSRYVHRLVISQLQAWKPPLNLDKEEIPEIFPCDHINLEPIFRRLEHIEELEMQYGMRHVGERFAWNMFKVSINDAKRLGSALFDLKKLRTFKLHTSNIDDSHIVILVKDVMKISTLEELDLTNCLIGDQGALCIAKLMLSHAKLHKLVLANNKIGQRGAEGIGYALTKDQCCPIKHLNLRLNPLGHKGVLGLFRALVRVQKVEELIISGCGFEDDTSMRLAAVIQLNTNLKLIDISNNWCVPGQQNICDAVMANSTLENLDMRKTNISEPYYSKITKKLIKNRHPEWETEEVEEEEELISVSSHYGVEEELAMEQEECSEEEDKGESDIV